MREVAIFSREKVKLLYRDHPKRESDYLIDEFLFDNETEKIYDEMRHNAK